MARRVGSFIDPVTGETHWFEPNTAKQIKLSPISARIYGKSNSVGMINFKIDNIDMLNVITIIAEYEDTNKTYRSEEQQIDELEFANILADAAFNETIIDENQQISQLKDAALENLQMKLLKEQIILNEASLRGIGFVYSKDKKVSTIDELFVSIVPNVGLNIELRQCVGPVLLSNLTDARIEFYIDDYKLIIDDFEITNEEDGKIKTYQISTENIIFSDIDNIINYESFNLDLNNDEMVDNFINSRNSLLDDLYEQDDSLDDRFMDIFG